MQATPTDQSAPEAAPSGLQARDLAIAAAVGAAAGAAAWLGRQSHLYGDGAGLVSFAAGFGGDGYHHALIVPLLRASHWLFGGAPAEALASSHALVAAASALAIGCLFLFLRGVGLTRGEGLFGACLFASTPSWTFFATSVEVHVPHVAAVLATAVLAVAGPWRRPALATLLVGAALAATYGTHVSTPLLGPGVVALCYLGSVRSGEPLRPAALLFGVGPALVALLIVAMGLAGLARTGRFDPLAVDREVEILDTFLVVGDPWTFVVDNVLAPAAALGPAALIGLLGRRLIGWRLVSLLLLTLPSLAFFSTWGVSERGAYFLPVLAFLAWPAALVARGRQERIGLALAAAAVIAIQLAVGRSERAEFSGGWSHDQRIELVERALPGGGQLMLLWREAPDARLWFPDVNESSIDFQVSRALVGGVPPAAVAEQVGALDLLLAAGPLAVDVSYRARSEFHGRDGRLVYFEAIEAAIRERFDVVEHELGVWRLLEVRAPTAVESR